MARTNQVFVFLVVMAIGIGTFVSSSNPAVAAPPALNHLFGSGSQVGGKNINLRVQLKTGAPTGGVDVRLSSNDESVNVPKAVHVEAGALDVTVIVTTDPVANAHRDVTITATLSGVIRTHMVKIKPTVLSRMHVQSVIRHGGVGKVTFVLSGPAPAGGYIFPLTVEYDGVCDFCGGESPRDHFQLGDSITVPAGQTSITFAVPAYIMQSGTWSEGRMPDLRIYLHVGILSPEGNISLDAVTRIRDFGDPPRPTLSV